MVTFIHKTFLGPGMEVTLFLRFEHFLPALLTPQIENAHIFDKKQCLT